VADPFKDPQPGDAQRDAIRVSEEVLGKETLEREQLTEHQLADKVERIKLQALRSSMSRDTAIQRGRAMGAHEAEKRGETGQEAEQRIKRAMSYAAWEYDGKPVGVSERYEREFGLGVLGAVAPGVRRGGPDMKKERK
jgi:hypothetical protein